MNAKPFSIIKTLLLAYLLTGAGIFGFAQKNPKETERLAQQYFEQKEFEKANLYFETLYDKDPEQWYINYYHSLLGAKEYSKAEKITKKQIKQNRNNVYFYVYLGKIYKLQEDPKKEKEAYEKALKELSPYPPNVQNLAGEFTDEQLYSYALQTYNKGRKATPDYPYFYERAEVFKLSNDINSMINEYLDALEFRESDIQTVQMQLQNSLGYDDEEGGIKNPILKQELQKRILKNPDKIILSEFLNFILLQQKDFDGAFIQSKSLDKRLKEQGQRIYDLARICVSNQQWETAHRCYNYLIEKGSGNVYYDIAIAEGLIVEYLTLSQNPLASKEDLLLLEQKLEKANQKYRERFVNQTLLKNLVMLKAYHLNKTDEAISLLDEYIKQSGADPMQRAENKILLGDIYLLKGEIWEASLLYSQVEKDYKYEAIGQEAKFRNAKLSFYAGEFTWAKAQADVLKGATTKLIANDALDLSLIISDAIAVDSTQGAPLSLFANAELMTLQHRYDEALQTLDLINSTFSQNTLGDDIYFKKAQIYAAQIKWTDAEEMYKNVLQYYPEELYGDDAQFKLAELYEYKLKDKEKARQAYEDVLLKYPGSIYTVEARKRFRELRGDQIKN
ncbi:MAG: tetratricopeptide repeat protein [Bacteroidia bacterium]|nr:tetratricopeptide repeat protein [Bacteroidia bacterium]